MILNTFIKRYNDKIKMNSMGKVVNKDKIIKEILKFLKSKGKIRAILLLKLIKHFCYKNTIIKIHISENELIDVLIEMVKKRIVEIIIPELFEIYWTKQLMKELQYFKDDVYYISEYREYKKNPFYKMGLNYFDTRQLNFKTKDIISNKFVQLKKILKKYPSIYKKTIIFYLKNSFPLSIYEKNSAVHYKLIDFNSNNKRNNSNLTEGDKLVYPLKKQRLDISIIGKYRNNYMCFYIPLIESIQKKIVDLQKSSCLKGNKLIAQYTQKFVYYCEMYVNSDWVDISEPNSLRWETFFQYFNIPIKILSFKINSLKFHGKTFDVVAELKTQFNLKRRNLDDIEKIKNAGLKLCNDSNNNIIIKLDVNFYLPCPSIEYFYFVSKYFYFYHLFLLFHYIFPYVNEKNKFSSIEKNLYKVFLPVLKDLFIMNNGELNKNFVFKYYTFNSHELELIYNKFLLERIKNIERKLYKFFIIRCSN
jgi:hypothetical protein